jgi:LCP family protein required for cell wall assembly
MADQRSDAPYDWLYADQKSRSAAPAPPPDLPPPNLPPPGRRAPKPPRPPRRRRPPWVRIALLVLVAWLIFLVAVPLWAYQTTSRIDAAPEGERPGDSPGTTYLLVGSDSRRGLSEAEQQQLSTGPDEGGEGRTDTIMLMHVGSGPTTLVSIPRDSMVPVPGYGTVKINAAYAYGGPKLLVETLESTTGLRIDAYVEVGFGGLVKVVDAVGGIEICPEAPIQDVDAGLDIQAGCQEADGVTALGYSRSRHSYQTQDIQRVQSQREVLGAIASEVKSPWTILNPFRYVSVSKGAASSVVVGEDVGPVQLARFALSFGSAVNGDGLNCTVPIRDFSVRWDSERALQLFSLIEADKTGDIGDLCTADGLPPA